MAFHEVQFPPRIAYGSSGGPGFDTFIISTDSGQEERVSRRSQARSVYNVASGIKKQNDIYELLNFFRCRDGAAHGFRYKDWVDYATTPDGIVYADDSSPVTHGDVQLGVGDGATTVFQLGKVYASGAITRSRKITKPVAGTVKVGLNGVNQTSGWSVDTTTGKITFTSAPSGGVVVTAGCEFDVPVRFGDDVDKQLSVQLQDYLNGNVEVPLIELIDESPHSDDFFYGGAREEQVSADFFINGIIRVHVIEAMSGGLKGKLPDPNLDDTYAPGGPWYYIYNVGATNSFVVTTSGGTTLATVTAGNMTTVVLTVDGVGNKVWLVG